MREGPLSDMLVLDLGQIYAGPYCSWLLAQLGARVIKVESPSGDLVRARTHSPAGPYAYSMLNSDKESVVLDLKTTEGRDLLLDLVTHADVLVENFSVGTMERLGLGEEVLLRRNPRLVVGSVAGFGLTGPYADRPAMDLTVQAMSGVMDVTGFPSGPPVKAGAAVSDFLGATHLCIGILAALLARQSSGRGQRVEASMHEATVLSLCSALSAAVDGGRSTTVARTGNRHPALSVAPYNVYAAAEGYVAINCPSQKHWASLTTLMGRPELASDHRYHDPVERTKRIDEVDALVTSWTSTMHRDQLISLLTAARIPCAPVLTINEVIEDPHLHARQAFVETADPARGSIRLPRSPVRLHDSLTPTEPRPAPYLGQDTADVLRQLLGLSPEDVEHFRAAGATGGH